MTAPWLDPELVKHRALVDSLVAATGGFTPDSIYSRTFTPSGTEGSYEHDPRRMVIRDRNVRDPRRVVAHEFGHVLQFNDQPAFFEWFDPEAKGKTPYPNDLERFANAFADAFEGLARGDTTSRRKDVAILMRALRERLPFKRVDRPPEGP